MGGGGRSSMKTMSELLFAASCLYMSSDAWNSRLHPPSSSPVQYYYAGNVYEGHNLQYPNKQLVHYLTP